MINIWNEDMRNLTIVLILLFTNFSILASADTTQVKITDDVVSVKVLHNGNPVTIKRNQSLDNKINPDYAITSRKCPPFCIQPGNIAEGVETITELELLEYLKR